MEVKFAIFLFTVISISFTITIQAQASGIVVTIPMLQGDVEKITNGTIPVQSLLKPGVDPHEYQLSPSDISFLQSASLIISTLHTPAEMQIDSMVKNGGLKATYIAIPLIDGIRYETILNNGIKNPHMPIYDPGNYLIFIKNLTETLDVIYPNLSSVFNKQSLIITQNIQELINKYAGKLNETAIASVPETQYAVEWTGLKILRFLVVDEEAGVQPQDLKAIEEFLSNGTAKFAIVAGSYNENTSSWIPYSTFDKTVVDMAGKYGVKVIFVPFVAENISIDNSLHLITEQIFNSSSSLPQQMQTTSQSSITYVIVVVLVIALILIGIIAYRSGKHEAR